MEGCHFARGGANYYWGSRMGLTLEALVHPDFYLTVKVTLLP